MPRLPLSYAARTISVKNQSPPHHMRLPYVKTPQPVYGTRDCFKTPPTNTNTHTRFNLF